MTKAPTAPRDRVALGSRLIGPGEPVFIVAEAGVNHDGDLTTALALVDAAADAGADAVKFQTFDPDQLVTADSTLASYQQAHVSDAQGQYEMLSRLRFGEAEHAAIVEHSATRRILFLSTPFDAGSAALLAKLGVPAFKVGSGELTNLPFLDELSRYSLPILLSTGMSDLDEVDAAVAVIQARGAPIVLLHCVSSYPAPAEEANLRAMDAMRAAFGLPVGYSDHCTGDEVSLAAVARDACILERHLTLDRGRAGPDHAMSMEPDELRDLIGRVRALERSLGDGRKRPQPSEQELRTVARRSIVARRALAAGEVLTADSLAIKRPGGGMPPSRLSSLVGARLSRDVAADEQLTDGHLA
jgi:N,N'-diacetyllegionaminate synthase